MDLKKKRAAERGAYLCMFVSLALRLLALVLQALVSHAVPLLIEHDMEENGALLMPCQYMELEGFLFLYPDLGSHSVPSSNNRHIFKCKRFY